jgi:hypothetical protein
MERGPGSPRDTANPPSSVLKGRLSDVLVPALVGGATAALVRRLGPRATLDDPLHGRGASVSAIEGALVKLARWWRDDDATYRQVASTTGVDCDVAEGILRLRPEGAEAVDVPIAVVAERKSMREIDVRLYYAPPGRNDARVTPASPLGPEPRALVARELFAALQAKDLGAALAAFDDDARAVDPRGVVHGREGGALEAWLSALSGLELAAIACADDGRRCGVEVMRKGSGSRHRAALFVLVRSDGGRLCELRAYGSAI